jgi:holo-[acyl-carrier-protein] synthase
MITGIGVDLIEISRVLKACEREHFLKRCYTEQEIELIRQDPKKAADNFAVKEAVAKMLGTGFLHFSPADIEVLRNPQGRPFVNLYGNAAELAREQGAAVIHVTITNTKEYSNAFAVGESR